MDGVLTDGGLFYGPTGEELKRFDVQDGQAMVAARRAGLVLAVISGRASAAVSRRLSELGIAEVHQAVEDKGAVLGAVMSRLGIDPAEVAAMGDDLGDIAMMKEAGLALAPRNAAPEVQRAAHWVAHRSGGAGAVREAIELLLRARNAWPPPHRERFEIFSCLPRYQTMCYRGTEFA